MLTLLGLDRAMSGLAPDLGVDLGSSCTPVSERGKGILFREPSYIAIDKRVRKIIAVGEKARTMDGRVPPGIEVVRPVRGGVVADYELTEAFLKRILRKAGQHGVFRPRVMLGVPVDATEVEERAVAEAARTAGARSVYILPQPVIAAWSSARIDQVKCCILCDIGAGTTQVALISRGRIVMSRCRRLGGDVLDQAIVSYLRRVHTIVIGERSAENLKLKIGAAHKMDPPLRAVVRGRDLYSGLPRQATVESNELVPVFKPYLEQMVNVVLSVMEAACSDLAGKVTATGVVMTGGTALLRGISRFFESATGLPCHTVSDPIASVACGAGRLFSEPKLLAQALEGYVNQRW